MVVYGISCALLLLKLTISSCASVINLPVPSSCKPDCEEMDVELGQEVGRWPELEKYGGVGLSDFSVSGFGFQVWAYSSRFVWGFRFRSLGFIDRFRGFTSWCVCGLWGTSGGFFTVSGRLCQRSGLSSALPDGGSQDSATTRFLPFVERTKTHRPQSSSFVGFIDRIL